MRQGQLGMRNSYTHLISSYLIFLMDVIYLGIDKARKLFIPIFLYFGDFQGFFNIYKWGANVDCFERFFKKISPLFLGKKKN